MRLLTRKLLWSILVLGLVVATPARAIREMVQPKQLLNYASTLYPKGAGELSAKIQADCYAQAGVISCSFTFEGIYWDASSSDWDKWRWKGTLVKTTQSPGNPPQTSTLTSSGTVYNICPGGFQLSPATPYCYRDISVEPDCDQCKSNVPTAALPPSVGNPIFPSEQIKVESKVDYENARGTLRFVRTYRSDINTWTHNYNMSLVDMKTAASIPLLPGACYLEKNPSALGRTCYAYIALGTTNDIALRRPGLRPRYFSSSNDYKANADVRDRVVPVTSDGITTWQVRNGETEALEIYDQLGRITSSTALNGQKTTFEYSTSMSPPEVAPRAGLLIKVTDAFGSSLHFTYDQSEKLATMTDPAGGLYRYAYTGNGNLASVTYPDGKTIQYLYELSTDMSALTGIIDENNVRFATFTYLGGSPTTTEHFGGVNKYIVEYEYSTQMKVTDPLGTVRRYQFLPILGAKRYTGMTQPGVNGEPSVSSTIDYDANGNVSSITDFARTVTKYYYDMTRNLETSRVEAYGTPLARTITTSWHEQYDKPLKIAEPKRMTSYTYDGFGNVLTKSVQGTTDATGASGLGATLAGPVKTWIYTYNAMGQVLTAKGPRTDVNGTTTYAYDSAGNLASITNAAGHVTSMSNYDPHGRVGTMTNPNGDTVTFSYTPRGWISARTVSAGGNSETTGFDYDSTGQLTKVTNPDGSTVNYSYDNAHRLLAIYDNRGNRIDYTLNNAGQRLTEKLSDANGVLARQVTRVYDILGRVAAETGGAQ